MAKKLFIVQTLSGDELRIEASTYLDMLRKVVVEHKDMMVSHQEILEQEVVISLERPVSTTLTIKVPYGEDPSWDDVIKASGLENVEISSVEFTEVERMDIYNYKYYKIVMFGKPSVNTYREDEVYQKVRELRNINKDWDITIEEVK